MKLSDRVNLDGTMYICLGVDLSMGNVEIGCLLQIEGSHETCRLMRGDVQEVWLHEDPLVLGAYVEAAGTDGADVDLVFDSDYGMPTHYAEVMSETARHVNAIEDERVQREAVDAAARSAMKPSGTTLWNTTSEQWKDPLAGLSRETDRELDWIVQRKSPWNAAFLHPKCHGYYHEFACFANRCEAGYEYCPEHQRLVDLEPQEVKGPVEQFWAEMAKTTDMVGRFTNQVLGEPTPYSPPCTVCGQNESSPPGLLDIGHQKVCGGCYDVWRYNYEVDDGIVMVCRHDHEKSAACTYHSATPTERSKMVALGVLGQDHSECRTRQFSSRVCQRGTKACDIDHRIRFEEAF